MSMKLNRIQVTATDTSAQSFDINTVEQLSECVNNQHNIDQMYGTLYFDNNEKVVLDNKHQSLAILLFLHTTKVIQMNLYPAH
jgi:peptide deformylase